MKDGKNENWPQKESRREKIISEAVAAADRVILEGSDGSVEETNYLTGQVAWKFVQKAVIPFAEFLSQKDDFGKQ